MLLSDPTDPATTGCLSSAGISDLRVKFFFALFPQPWAPVKHEASTPEVKGMGREGRGREGFSRVIGIDCVLHVYVKVRLTATGYGGADPTSDMMLSGRYRERDE